ncbi:MAG: hypothetical protein ABIP93_00545 [Gemmatimonadaceae bacterium]
MRHTIARDGIIAGVLGATAVAIWFLGIDIIYSHPFATPDALGRGLLRVLGPPGSESTATFVTVYTLFHFVAFIAVGLLVSAIVHWAQREPTILAGAMILFIALEIGIYGLSSALRESPLFGVLGSTAVATGNLVAAVVMGTYMWRTHPELKRELDQALGGQPG